MGAVDLDGQSIERRDFPVTRRGYEPAAVDAHLRSVANAVAELSAQARRGESVGAAAGTQVQGILDAADATAAQILGDAREQAARTIQDAQVAAQRTRSDAIAQAEAHIAAVAQAAAALRARVESMDADLHGLAETLRAGGGKLAGELGALERDMAALYDAASGRQAPVREEVPQASPALTVLAELGEPPAVHVEISENGLASAPQGALAAEHEPVQLAADPVVPLPPVAPVAPVAPEPALPGVAGEQQPSDARPAPSGDLDGARLIALNMALNGDPREATDRYLAEHFDLAERQKLIDEVYAAIEG